MKLSKRIKCLVYCIYSYIVFLTVSCFPRIVQLVVGSDYSWSSPELMTMMTVCVSHWSLPETWWAGHMRWLWRGIAYPCAQHMVWIIIETVYKRIADEMCEDHSTESSQSQSPDSGARVEIRNRCIFQEYTDESCAIHSLPWHKWVAYSNPSLLHKVDASACLPVWVYKWKNHRHYHHHQRWKLYFMVWLWNAPRKDT